MRSISRHHDRFMALYYHMRYNSLVTQFRVRCTVAIIWLIMFLWLGFYFWNKFVYHLMATIFTTICCVVCTISYIRIYGIVWRHQVQIHAQQMALGNLNTANDLQMTRLKRSALINFGFNICMVICHFPNFVFMTLFGTKYEEWKTEWTFSTTVTSVHEFGYESLLYYWRLRELRAAVGKVTKKLLCKLVD